MPPYFLIADGRAVLTPDRLDSTLPLQAHKSTLCKPIDQLSPPFEAVLRLGERQIVLVHKGKARRPEGPGRVVRIGRQGRRGADEE